MTNVHGTLHSGSKSSTLKWTLCACACSRHLGYISLHQERAGSDPGNEIKGRWGRVNEVHEVAWREIHSFVEVGHGGRSRSDDGEDIIVIKASGEDHSMRVWDA